MPPKRARHDSGVAPSETELDSGVPPTPGDDATTESGLIEEEPGALAPANEFSVAFLKRLDETLHGARTPARSLRQRARSCVAPII
jgi:hypothetical protein